MSEGNQERLHRIQSVIEKITYGDFDQVEEIPDPPDDDIGKLEQGINLVVMDLQAVNLANKEKESYLLMQQQEMSQQQQLIDEQQSSIEHKEKELATKLEIIEQQSQAILELSTPVIEIWDRVMAMPIVGLIDSKRGFEIMNNLLEAISNRNVAYVILDVTGVEIVDTKTADQLIKVVRAARLLGAQCILTGLSPAVAQTLVEIDADLSEITTLRSLKDALRLCLDQMNSEVNQGGVEK